MTARQQLAALFEAAWNADDMDHWTEIDHAFDRAYDATLEAGVSDDAPDDVWEEARAVTALALLGVTV